MPIAANITRLADFLANAPSRHRIPLPDHIREATGVATFSFNLDEFGAWTGMEFDHYNGCIGCLAAIFANAETPADSASPKLRTYSLRNHEVRDAAMQWLGISEARADELFAIGLPMNDILADSRSIYSYRDEITTHDAARALRNFLDGKPIWAFLLAPWE